MCSFNRGWVRLLILVFGAGLADNAKAAGALLVSSPNEGAVRKYDPNTGASQGYFVSPGAGGLSNTIGLALGPDANLYVAGTESHDVLRYNGSTGAFMDVFATNGSNQVTFLTFAPLPEPQAWIAASGALLLLCSRRRSPGRVPSVLFGSVG